MNHIDFVIPWVDGSDAIWQAEFSKYRRGNSLEDTDFSRYRDWDVLQYWFRSIEEFAPWVRKIHFITQGHLPKWMNINHPKLNIVKHSDYIPTQFLPTFSSNPIELNMCRIKDLSDHFVYFNDDTFILKNIDENRFFNKNLPVDIARLSIIADSSIDHIILNNLKIINRHFRKKNVINKNICKWFNSRYLISDLLKSLTLLPWDNFSGFKDLHMPQAYLKETFQKIWEIEPEILKKTSSSKFRSVLDVNQYLMRYWQLVEGNFYPHGCTDTKLLTLGDESIENISEIIEMQKYAMICINDSDEIKDFEKVKMQLINSFKKILPQKSLFEL